MEQKIILDVFSVHIDKLMKSISEPQNAFMLLSGKEDGSIKPKTRVMFIWLTGYDMIETILIVTKKSVIYLASQKKLQMLDEAKQKLSGKINFLLLPKAANNTDAFNKMIEQVKKDSGSSVLNWSALIKEKQAGSLAQEWNDYIKTQNLQTIEAAPMIQQLLAVKDAVEIGFIQQSAQFTCYLMRKFISQVENSIDQNIKVQHSELSKKIENLIDSVSEKQKFLNMGLQEGSYELGQYPPIVQSGGFYQFTGGNASTSNQILSTDVIILSVSGQVNAYNTIISRTLFIDPTERQKRIYNHVLEVQSKACQLLVPGVKLNDVYSQVKAIWDTKKSDLDLPECPNLLGYGIGLEYKEVIIQINEKNEKVVEPNMIFLVQVIVEKLQQGQKGITWAISLGDIVNITNSGPQVLTQAVSKLYKNISYQLQDDEEEVQQPKQQNNQQKQNNESRGAGQNNARTRGPRNQQIQQHRLNEQQRQKHQLELQAKKQQELEERLERDGFSKEYQQTKALELNKLNCYKQPEQIPREAKQGQIYIDHAREAILLPFQGTHIPFHVSCIKNVSKIDEGRIGASLRINFFTTETSAGNIQFPQIDGQTIFIKELQYRSRTMVRLQELINQIKQLQKKVKAEQQVERERAHTGDVEPLILNRGGRKPVFKDLKIRPVLVSGKGQGSLELHTNGLRYIYNNKDYVDIVFKNVKHYLYQSPENEIIAALHFHLISPIIIGKKKTQDVQFYCEVSGGVEHLEGRRRQQRNDEDEIEDEERQRVQRRKMHREFDAFIKSVEEAAKDFNVIFERPYREHGFEGNWNRARIFLQPTLNTLMNIVETPFFILPLNEVELACFERVMPGIKSFDLVFVFQNYEKPVLRLESIDIKDLEGVKNWLDRMNIIFFEVAQNLVWKNVLATIAKDIAGFVEDGGWTTVLGESDEEGEVEEEVEEGDSEFAPENSNEESEFSDEDDEEDGDFEEDDDDEYSDGEENEEEYSVIDMDNLSEQESDQFDDSDDDDDRKKKKGSKQQPPPQKKNPIGKKK